MIDSCQCHTAEKPKHIVLPIYRVRNMGIIAATMVHSTRRKMRDGRVKQTSGWVDQPGDYLNLLKFSARTPTLLRLAWSC